MGSWEPHVPGVHVSHTGEDILCQAPTGCWLGPGSTLSPKHGGLPQSSALSPFLEGAGERGEA